MKQPYELWIDEIIERAHVVPNLNNVSLSAMRYQLLKNIEEDQKKIETLEEAIKSYKVIKHTHEELNKSILHREKDQKEYERSRNSLQKALDYSNKKSEEAQIFIKELEADLSRSRKYDAIYLTHRTVKFSQSGYYDLDNMLVSADLDFKDMRYSVVKICKLCHTVISHISGEMFADTITTLLDKRCTCCGNILDEGEPRFTPCK